MKRNLFVLAMLLLGIASAWGLDIDKNLYYTISPRNNHEVYMKDTGKDVIQCNAGLDTYSYWRFIPTGNEGCYYVQNLYTLRYAQQVAETKEVTVKMGTEPVEYFIMSTPSEGTDCFGMTSSDHSNLAFNSANCFAMNWHEDNKNVQSYMAAVGTNHKSFWFLRDVEPPSCLLGSHEFEHGFCSICGALDLNYVTKAEDGFYEISDGYQLEWFSALVNTGINDASARLMNDIDMQGIDHTPIAKNVDLRWRGTFDGQGHRILNLVINRPTENIQGLFGYLRGNADSNTRVCNLIIDKSCSFTGYHQVGAIAGCSQGNQGLITLENIVNEADVTAEGGTDAAALVGGQTGNAPTWRIRNIVNTGAITSTAADGYAGVIAGYYGNNAQNYQENIINLGVVTGFNGDLQMGRLTGTIINMFDISGTEGAGQGLEHDFTAEDIASGRLCYYLNGNQSNIIFYQTLGQDAYPVPFATSMQVYMQGTLLCDGTPVGEEGTYSNSNEGSIVPPHTFVDGEFYCTVCGAFNEHFVEPVDGILHMSTPIQLEWLAEYVATGHENLEVVMDNDIDMDGVYFAGIGSLATPFLGHFDGQYHTISNLVMEGVDHDWSGFFNFIRGGSTIENLRLDENCYLTGAKGTALIGGCGMAGNVLLRNLGFEGNVDGLTTCAGAVLGANFQSIAKLTVENCYSTGSIAGGAESAALVAWLGNNGAVISNCWTSASATGIQGEDKYAFRHDNAIVTNCFSFYGSQAQRFEFEELESGSLCYRLNGDQSTIRWYQNLDNDQEQDFFPTFIPTHGTVVVRAEMRCDGTYDPDLAYFSNSGDVVIPPHTFVDGFCQVCGAEDEEYPFIRIFANADHEAAGGYVNNQSNDGSGLAINNSVAEHWNQKWFDSYQNLTGLQAGLYKLRVQGLSRVKAWTNDDFVAYEEAELNPDYVQLYHNSQYYVDVNGRRISNLFMDIAKGRQEKMIGNGTQTYHGAGYYVPNSLAACHSYFLTGLYWNEPIYFVVESEQDTVKVGVENQMYLSGNWTVWDTWRLERVEEADDETAVSLILAQQEKNVQALDELEAQTQLMSDYEAACNALNQANSLEGVLGLADQLSRLPEQIRLSHLAYIDYSNAVLAILDDVEGREQLNGDYAELLYTYLNDDSDDVEGLPNGTYQHIMETKELDVEELRAEVAFVQELLNLAIKNSITEGSDLTNLIVNPGMDIDAQFTGWQRETTRTGEGDNNLSCQTGYGDIYYVAGSLNTAFRVWQDLEEGLPDGIYEIQIPAYYRPGGKGEGDTRNGNDIISADIFINDYHTPMMNIYKDVIPYSEAINGVNCRYDAVNDPEAPHNGQDTGSQDYDTGSGYVPHQRPGSSFAFSAGRYINHAYAIVEDGKLTIGVRNTETPWYPGGLAVWGKFQLRYHGKSLEAMNQMTQNFVSRLNILRLAQSEQDFYISTAHIQELENLIATAQTITDADDKMAVLKQINDEFNTINTSYSLYQDLNTLIDYCNDQGDVLGSDDPMSDELFMKADEIWGHMLDGDLTDEEAEQYATDIRDDASLGGGFYVRGDLLDAEGVEVAYDSNSKIYPLQRQEDGTYTGVFTTQNRANLVHTDARAGIYFTRFDQTFKSNQPYRRFVTPEKSLHPLVAGAGQDYQMIGAKMQVTLNPKDSTVLFEPIEYEWHDHVFVCGSIIDENGAEHRWKNDEAAPLIHRGNGLYIGKVRFFEDYVYPGYATFIIMASRSTLENEAYSTVTRPGWLEASYTGTMTDCILTPGEVAEDLIRGYGNNRRFRIEWTPGDGPKDYLVIFNMNTRTIEVMINDGSDPDSIQDIMSSDATVVGIYDLQGRKMANDRLPKGIYIVNGKKVVIK